MAKTTASGFSLISTLVGLVIGMFVVSAAASIYIDSERNARFHEALAAMHDNARYALQDLNDTIILTGRKVSTQHRVFGSYRTLDRAGILNADLDNTDGVSDSIIISYAAGKECGLHREVDDGIDTNEDMLAFEFRVNNQSQLECVAHGYNPADPDSTRILVDGISNMQVLYGTDIDGDGVADRYANATTVEAEDAWNTVISVRIGLLVSSADFEVFTGDSGSGARTFDVLDQQVTIPADNKQLYRVYTTTIALRNMMGLSRQAGF